MKKVISFLLAATMALSLAACGNSGSGGSGDAITIDLSAFYTEMYDSIFPDPDNAPALSEITGDYLEQTYPGLSEVETKQCLAYAPMITAVAYEIALVEVADSSDVDTVKGIFQDRIDAQVASGAWYPSAIEAWQNNSRVVSNGSYVMMVVHEDCDAIVNEFNALF